KVCSCVRLGDSEKSGQLDFIQRPHGPEPQSNTQPKPANTTEFPRVYTTLWLVASTRERKRSRAKSRGNSAADEMDGISARKIPRGFKPRSRRQRAFAAAEGSRACGCSPGATPARRARRRFRSIPRTDHAASRGHLRRLAAGSVR